MTMAFSVEDILDTSNDNLRAAVRALCTDDVEVRNRLAKYIYAIQHPGPKDDTKEKLTTASKADSAKLFLCAQCDKTFLESENQESAPCVFHPGELELNEDSSIWDEWDDAIYGYPDTPANEKEYPEGFKFTCCSRSGDQPGCAFDKHKTEETLSKELEEPLDNDKQSENQGSHSRVSQGPPGQQQTSGQGSHQQPPNYLHSSQPPPPPQHQAPYRPQPPQPHKVCYVQPPQHLPQPLYYEPRPLDHRGYPSQGMRPVYASPPAVHPGHSENGQASNNAKRMRTE